MGNENESKEKKGKSLEKLPYVFNYTQHYDIYLRRTGKLYISIMLLNDAGSRRISVKVMMNGQIFAFQGYVEIGYTHGDRLFIM